MKLLSIAIDGPAGSGKSTIAKLVAAKFNYLYIDTGAMYRAITYKALRQKMDLTDQEGLTRLAENTEIRLKYLSEQGKTILHVYVDGQDVSEAIRSLEVTGRVSVVAAIAGVRKALVALQQKMASHGGVVMDGRDIGTVVLPKAELKVFLTASVAERGRRRWLELQAKGIEVDKQELIAQIEQRDYQDSHREVDPLCQAQDALLLDTTDLTIDAVVSRILDMALQRGAVLER